MRETRSARSVTRSFAITGFPKNADWGTAGENLKP